ncbi:hypothetical protein K488DRAFT_89449 [Vararia minispora EC-137]|uniref:Uncharacterized protein n=1 Tax=Vararia minispora EC-137 TaxID=1314806 RepID=A0ACB8QAG3_9AGAM|nr:hypothetical protein K488DRAFT_89449 [Vararia minispora EC-137]
MTRLLALTVVILMFIGFNYPNRIDCQVREFTLARRKWKPIDTPRIGLVPTHASDVVRGDGVLRLTHWSPSVRLFIASFTVAQVNLASRIALWGRTNLILCFIGVVWVADVGICIWSLYPSFASLSSIIDYRHRCDKGSHSVDAGRKCLRHIQYQGLSYRIVN